MSKLTGRPSLPAVNLAIKNNARAYAFRNEHQDEISCIAHLRTSKPKLGQRDGIGIIIYDRRESERS